MKEKWWNPKSASGRVALIVLLLWLGWVAYLVVSAFIVHGTGGGGSCFYDCG